MCLCSYLSDCTVTVCRGADRDINPANEFRNSSSTLCHSPLAPRELVSLHPSPVLHSLNCPGDFTSIRSYIPCIMCWNLQQRSWVLIQFIERCTLQYRSCRSWVIVLDITCWNLQQRAWVLIQFITCALQYQSCRCWVITPDTTCWNLQQQSWLLIPGIVCWNLRQQFYVPGVICWNLNQQFCRPWVLLRSNISLTCQHLRKRCWEAWL